MFWSGAYMIIGLGDQYVENYHNKETYISSVAMYVGILYMHTFLPLPYHMMFGRYGNHAALQIFICLK